MNLHAASIGAIAAKVLDGEVSGKVLAVFRRSFYIRFPMGLICLGDRSIGDGPINVPLRSRDNFDYRTLVSETSPVLLRKGWLLVGGTTTDLRGARLWSSPELSAWDPQSASSGRISICSFVPATVATGGLAELILHDNRRTLGAVGLAAAPAVAELEAFVQGRVGEPRAAVKRLLGLGPGLTPSGDDFLTGYFTVLRAAGRGADARTLRELICALAAKSTNEISLAHLNATFSEGLNAIGSDLLNALLRNSRGRMPAIIGELERAASFSGWDVLAGMVCAIEATCGSQPCRSPTNSLA